MKDTKEILDYEEAETQLVEVLDNDLNEDGFDKSDESMNETLMDEKRFLSLTKTNASSHYHASLDAIPCLSYEDEVRYCRMMRYANSLDEKDDTVTSIEARKNGILAKQVMIEHNLRLVRSIARKYVGRGVLLDDLIQEGNIGLMEAIDKYNPELGYRFSTYAVFTIRQKIKRGCFF